MASLFDRSHTLTMDPLKDPPSSFVERFRSSMPEAYRSRYNPEQVRAHAAISWRRASAPAHVEQWSDEADGTRWICVITDDRRGLLSLLSAAITAHCLD